MSGRRADFEADPAPGRRDGRGPSRSWRRWRRGCWPVSTGPSPPSPDGLPLRAQRRPHGRLDAPRRRASNFELPPILQPLAPFQRGPPRPQRPGLRQGPGQRRRRGRPRPGVVRLPDRDARRGRPPGPTSAPGSRPTRSPPAASATGPGSPRWNSGSSAIGAAGTATAATRASTSTPSSWRSPTSPLPNEVDPKLIFDRLFSGAARRPRPPQAEPVARQRPRRGPRRRQGAGEQARRLGPPEARPVSLLRPGAGAADLPGRDAPAGPAAGRCDPAGRARRPSFPSTSA